MDERELVTGCRNGDEKALRLLYDRYAPWMMGISMRYTGNTEDSKDILHDSFVKVLVSLRRFEYRGDGSLKVWISRIVVNTAINFLKKDKAFFEKDSIAEIVETEEEEGADHLELYRSVPDGEIVRSIGQLPKRLRAVFNMYMFENMSHGEIADELEISEAASRVRLHRAKDMLAKALKELVSTEER